MPSKCVFNEIRGNCGYHLLFSVYRRCRRSMALKKQGLVMAMGATILVMISCRHELPGINDPGSGPADPPVSTNCSQDSVYFQQQVLPLFISNCAQGGCHDAVSHTEGMVLTSYASIMNAGVRKGNPSESKVYKVIIETNVNDRMPPPPHAPLSKEQIELINKWITQGAPNNSCVSATCDSSVVTYTASIQPVITTKCRGCHSGSTPGGGYDFTNYTGLKKSVDNGRLWGSVNFVSGFSGMPKGGSKLSTCELARIKKWIDSGAPNN